MVKALGKIENSGRLKFDVTNGTREFIEKPDEYGQYRYFEGSNAGFGAKFVTIDHAA